VTNFEGIKPVNLPSKMDQWPAPKNLLQKFHPRCPSEGNFCYNLARSKIMLMPRRDQAMRVLQNPQMQIGEVDIAQTKIDPKSRDDIPRLLQGLQYLYANVAVREKIFQVLEKKIAPQINKRNGRPGMALWKIFVCGVIRLDLNEDYDRLYELVNHHDVIRQMLGHGDYDKTPYHFQTLKDNVSLLTVELLDEINQIIVEAGHGLIKKKADEALRGRCDSFVVETNVHYPTDITLLFDAIRKVITLTARLCEEHGMTEWRQHVYNIKHTKRMMRIAQSKKRTRANTPEQQAKRQSALQQAHQDYLDVAQRYVDKAEQSLLTLMQNGHLTSQWDLVRKIEIDAYLHHAHRQIDQTQRRVIHQEKIPHEEKVFSIFESHTEWISKGKAGVPVELGLKVGIMEDQHQFILHHQVMQRQTDSEVAISMVQETKQRFTHFAVCSFDKGFHSPENQQTLANELNVAALPKKGKLSQQAKAWEQSEPFKQARKKHAAVESAINALEVHGLDRCLDRGLDGFQRYVALAMVARNIHRIGDIRKQQQEKRAKRKKKRPDQDNVFHQYAA
jgi:hypothetical protein